MALLNFSWILPTCCLPRLSRNFKSCSQGTFLGLGFCSILLKEPTPKHSIRPSPKWQPLFHMHNTSCIPSYVLTGHFSNLFWKLRHTLISALALYVSSQKNSQVSAIQAPENKGLHLYAWAEALSAIWDALKHPRYTWGWQISHRTYGSGG